MLNIKSKWLYMRCFSYLNWFKLNWCSILKTRGLKDSIGIRNNIPCFVLMIQIISTIFVSCTTENRYSFSSPDDAILEYQIFAKNISRMTQSETDELIFHICNWQELSDSVFKYISRDPSFDAHFHLTAEFLSAGDSIRTNILRLSCSQNRSLEEILKIKDKTSSYRNDKSILLAKDKAHAFYEQFSNTMINPSTKDEAISAYCGFLDDEKKRGISTMDDFFRFIMFEDLFFRGFLQHLSEYGATPLTDITANTEDVCKQIFEAASSGNLDSKEVVLYMAVRTNRRLILNAQTCIDEIKAGNIQGQEQLAAYQWMIIQPFLSIDGFSVALLSDRQKYELQRIANDFSDILHQLETNNANAVLQCDELAQQILKIYISSL